MIGAIGDRDRVAALGLEGAPGVDHLVPILEAVQARLGAVPQGRAHRHRGRRAQDRRRQLRADRRPLHGREPRADARGRPRRSPRRGDRCSAAAPTSRGPRRTASRASASRACACSPRRKEETGLPIVTELMDVRDIDDVVEVADVIQIGARNMQNYSLLAEVGRTGLPVLLKRGLSATLEELLMAAEYVLKEGNDKVMLCERGIRTFETALPVHARPPGGPGAQASCRICRSSSTRATRRAGATGCGRCRWRPPRRAPTGSSSRSTTSPSRRSATGRRRCRRTASPSTPSRSRRVAEVVGKQLSAV